MTSRHDQRNFFPAAILTFVWWGLLLFLVFAVDPQVVADFPFTGSYGIFFGLTFLAVGFSASLVLGHTRRGFLVALGLVIFGYLLLGKLAHWINGLLLAGFLAALEYYWSNKKPVDKNRPHRVKQP